MPDAGILYVVATPIGNLNDFSERAREILSSVDIILAERPSVSRKLLSHFDIHPPKIYPYQDQNEKRMSEQVIGWLQAGQSIALISDAGTPLISDPGFRLVEAVHQHDLCVSPIPGPSSCIAALSVSGLAVDSFLFSGFLPHKTKARRDQLSQHDKMGVTLVYFESVHRIEATLRDIAEVMGGERRVCVARELTKKFESVIQAPVAEICQQIGEAIPVRGEWVIIIEPNKSDADVDWAHLDPLAKDLLKKMTIKDVSMILSRHFPITRSHIYDRLILLKKNADNLEPK